jgi:splicing factor U2AF subunit
MAENLARILGSEEDRVNCPFFFKNGACRYGEHCTRAHLKPTKSVTLLFAHMYQNPPLAIALAEGHPVPDDEILKVIEHFESFYAEVFLEVAQFGEIEEMHVVDNIGDHMIGNVYVKFVSEDDAESAKKGLSGRYFNQRLVMPEYSPVTEFREGRCRQFDTNSCRRGSYCNFMHIKVVRKDLLRALFKQMYVENPQYKDRR